MKPRVFFATYTWGVRYSWVDGSGRRVDRTTYYAEWSKAVARAIEASRRAFVVEEPPKVLTFPSPVGITFVPWEPGILPVEES